MRFALTEEQLTLRDAARAFLTEIRGSTPISEEMSEQHDEYDSATWERIVEEQGWPAILVPEDAGGWGFGLVEMAVVFEEVGRSLTPSPLFATVWASVLVTEMADDAQRDALLEGLASGQTATVAATHHITATQAGEGWELNGTAPHVIDGHSAELVLIPTEHGVFVVPQDAFASERVASLDTTRPVAKLTLNGVSLTESSRLTDGNPARGMARAAVLLAAEQVGAAEACLDESVDYAKVRQQFGKAIGSFQAIQHKCADMLLQIESARSAVWYAAWAIDSEHADATLAAHTAKATASDALFQCAGQTIQIHGGIGFTWEHMAHLYFKRARASMDLLGHPRAHRREVAATLLDGKAP